MSIDTYIASGILELYVAGVLSAAEMVEVDAAIQENERVAEEVERIIAGVNAYSAHQYDGPVPSIEAILEKIRNTPDEEVAAPSRNARNTQANNAPSAKQDKTNKVETGQSTGPKGIHRIQSLQGSISREENRNRPSAGNRLPGHERPIGYDHIVAAAPAGLPTRSFSWLAIAASILLLISVGGNIMLYFQLNNSQTALLEEKQKATGMGEQYSALQTNFKQMKDNMMVYEDKNYKHISLQGQEGYSGNNAMVFWNRATQEVKITATQLQKLPSGKVYQLWAIDIQGNPVDAGMITSKEMSVPLQNMKQVGEATAFAITIEPMGGSATPTMPIVAKAAI